MTRCRSGFPGFFFAAALVALVTPRGAAAQTVGLSNPQVVVGADQLDANPGFTGDWWPGSIGTFYNTSVTKVSGTYYIWAQTGWSEAGCTSAADGLDNVVVFKSTSPTGGFHPRACSNPSCDGAIGQSEMRRSLVTDSLANNLCDDSFMWGLGDVIPYSGSQYLATFDLAKDGAAAGDSAKRFFYLAKSDGRDRTSPMHLFAQLAPSLGRIMVDPVPFKVDSNTVGVFFVHSWSNFTFTEMGYLTIDFTSFPGSFTVKALDSTGAYRTLSPANSYLIDFQLGFLDHPQSINRVLGSGTVATAYYSTVADQDAGTCGGGDGFHSELGYRSFQVHPDGRFLGWLQPPQAIGGSAWDYETGINFPSPLLDTNGTRMFYTRDSQCAGNTFTHRDIVHATLLP